MKYSSNFIIHNEKEYNEFLNKCLPKQRKFIEYYLDSLSKEQAYLKAGYKGQNSMIAGWMVYRRVMPAILYQLKNSILINREYLAAHWLKFIEGSKDTQAVQKALVELGKLYSLSQAEQKVEVINNNNVSPVKICFADNDDNEEGVDGKEDSAEQ